MGDIDQSFVADVAQRSVIELPASQSAVVVGAPGTGKTATLIARVRSLLTSHSLTSDEIVVLTPSRQSATALRDPLIAGLDITTPGALARSVQSFAFSLVRSAAVADRSPSPQLLTAADQDRLIAEVLEGDAEDELAGVHRWPPTLGPATRASRDFRTELRTFAAQCVDLDLDTATLTRLGEATANPVWVSAASFLDDYRYALRRMREGHRDAADLIHEASTVLLSPVPLRLGLAAKLKAVFVDDAQELTRGGVAILRALRARGVAVMAFGDPDIASGAFRGAGPELFAEVSAMLQAQVVLDQQHRSSAELTRLTRVVTSAIGAGGTTAHRRPPGEEVDHGSVRTLRAASGFEEIDLIARTLRGWHLHDEISWNNLAVIAHDTRQVAQLESELAAREVPTRALSVARPLGHEAVVRDLLLLVRLAMNPVHLRDAELWADTLCSPYGGVDAVGLRRIRARLRVAELAEGGTRSANQLLCEAMAEPALLTLLDTRETRLAARLAATVQHLHADAEAGASIHELMWTAWDRSRLAQEWSRIAAVGGSTGAEASRALDAMVAVFGAAKRAVERGVMPPQFLHELLDADIPEDLLDAPLSAGAVTVMTPSAALGSEFEAVVVAGVQEGVWPNVRLRGGLLDTWRLAEELAAWRSGSHGEPTAVLDRRRSALHEELRLFARAISRAQRFVMVTAVDDDDQTPSAFFGVLPPPEEIDRADSTGEHPLTLRGMVSHHRRTLTTSSDAARRHSAAVELVALANAGVPGAAPHEWFGISEPSSTEPLYDFDSRPVPVSPSRLEGFETCPLDWAIKRLGGDRRSLSSGLGTILHAAMEEAPEGGIVSLTKVLNERWDDLDFEAPWIGMQEQKWAHELVARLDGYLQEVVRNGGVALGSEAGFRLAIELPDDSSQEPRVWVMPSPDATTPLITSEDAPPARMAILSGTIDRVEVYPPHLGEELAEGTIGDPQRVVVVDLKTGRSEQRVSAPKVVDDAQLAAYQLAVTSGAIAAAQGLTNAGARLLVLSKTQARPYPRRYRIAHQAATDPHQRTAFLLRVAADARAMASHSFTAHLDAHCTTDRFARCPIHTVKSVSAP